MTIEEMDRAFAATYDKEFGPEPEPELDVEPYILPGFRVGQKLPPKVIAKPGLAKGKLPKWLIPAGFVLGLLLFLRR